MIESEILEILAKSRGTILCFGLNDIPPLRMVGIQEKPKDWTNLLIIPSDKKIFSLELKCFVRGIGWRLVNYVANIPINSLLVISSVPQIESYISSQSTQDIKDYLESLYMDFNLQAISIVDSFPFHTKEGLQQIENIREYCKDKGISFKVGLLHGINKYGSTDISSEDEAVEQEKKFLLKEKNIECIEIDKVLSVEHLMEFMIEDSNALSKAVQKFNDVCLITLQNLELMDNILCSLLQIPLSASLKEYVDLVKNKLQELDILFPCYKYLNDRFFEEYGKSISVKFNSRRDSTNDEVSRWCAETLSFALKQWIKTSKIKGINEK